MSRAELVNTPERPSLRATLAELWSFRELIIEFTRRSIMLRYKNSVLGIAWSLVTPLMMILMITVMTKFIFQQPIPNYSAYLFPVMFAWTFCNNAIPDMCISLLESASIVRRSYFPRELLPIATLLASLLHFGISMGLTMAYLVLLHIFPWQVNVKVLLVLLIVPANLAFLLGVGLVTSVLNVIFEDIRFVVTVVLQLMLYAVPVLYPIERVAAAAPDGWWLRLYLLNPFASLLVLYQKALLPPISVKGVEALPWSWGLLAQTWIISLLTLWLGLWFFNRLKYIAVERL
ncbi:MAG: ABC transporter permease [Armatimonadetes bacterium]|nr:ABC transporter permease [Armatimonadota bacterium]